MTALKIIFGIFIILHLCPFLFILLGSFIIDNAPIKKSYKEGWIGNIIASILLALAVGIFFILKWCFTT